MTFYEVCPLCDFKSSSWAMWDFHRQVEHLRDFDPCERCGQWDDERTLPTQFGVMHPGCANQLAREQAEAHIEETG